MSSLISEQDAQLGQKREGTPRTGAADPWFPLSPMQQQIWARAQVTGPAPVYNHALVMERAGLLEMDALRQSLMDVARRHSALRTRFANKGGKAAQSITNEVQFELFSSELKTGSDEQRATQLREAIRNEVRRPFHLEKGPMLRVRALHMPGETGFIIITAPRLVADLQSLAIIGQDLASCYEAFSRGELITGDASGGDASGGDAEVAHGAVPWLRSENLPGHLAYWREQLAGAPPALDLPADGPRLPAPRFRAAQEAFFLRGDISKLLGELSEVHGTTLPVTLLAAFQVLLSRYTGQHDVLTGFFSGAHPAGMEGIVGPFASPVPIRANLEGEPTFRDFLQQVSRRVREASKQPFDYVLEELKLHGGPERNPLFQVLFSTTPSIAPERDGWRIADFSTDSGTAEAELEARISETPEGIGIQLTYDAELFEAATIARLGRNYLTLLRGISENPDQNVSCLPLLDATERKQLLIDWNDTRTEYPSEKCIHQLFERQVAEAQDAIAVVFENERITYGKLNTRANRLAHYLRRRGVGPDVLVGICLERSLDMVVALLGILKAGGAYVPLDPAYPRDRLSFMLEDAEAPLLITQSGLVPIFSGTQTQFVALDQNWSEIGLESGGNPATPVNSDHLAYVIYTSGSTGKPKGVQIQHGSVVNFLNSMARCPGISREDRLLAITTLSFDIAGLEIYLPLSVGASLEIVSREVATDGKQLARKLGSSGATLMQATPATWRMLLEAGWEGNPGLKGLCGGEAWSRSLADQLLKRIDSLWNMYGPTETTIWSTVARVERGEKPLTIGRPIANTQTFILDKQLQPVPAGIAGELYIGGDGLARGYLKRPELTQEKFMVNPFDATQQSRLYRTGDLARYLPSGEIDFLGRVDHQVKIRGFRIEVGEIETALRRHEGMKEAIVIAREDATGEQQLRAYFVPSGEAVPTGGELRGFLKKSLPDHMLPSVFVALRAMPLTPNGKIDRRALPEPEQSNLVSDKHFAAPADAIEAQLAAIWESVLGIRPIGTDDNFFEMGGHSLIAVRLMRRIEEAFGANLPIATLLQAPTVGQLAQILRGQGSSSPWLSLVPIQPGTSRPALFCVHGVGANVLRFRDLAEHLGPDQPFYGLQAVGVSGKHAPHIRTEDMATHYIEEIRTAQPKGPYILAGYSFGGLVALEMGQQLIARGEEPPVIILFDTHCPSMGGEASQTIGTVSSALLNGFRMSGAEKTRYVLRIATAPVREVQRRLHVLRLPGTIKKVRRACLAAARDYAPKPYPGRLILFRSSHKPLARWRDPYARWHELAQNGLEIYQVPGNHENILLEPQVRAVAQQLRECIASLEHRPAAIAS